MIKELDTFFLASFNKTCPAEAFASKNLWLEASKAWVRHLDKTLAARMEDDFADGLVDATIKAVQSEFSAEAMRTIKARTKCSYASLQVIVDTLCKTFDTATRKHRPRALPDLPADMQQHLHRAHTMPQLAGPDAVKGLVAKLRAEYGLQFDADGTLVTVDPIVRLRADVQALYNDGIITEGDALTCAHRPRP